MTVFVADDDASYFEYLQKILKEYLTQNDQSSIVTIGVSGGSMPKYLCPVLIQLPAEQRKKIRLFPVDERLVSYDNADNNMSTYIAALSAYYDSTCFVRVRENTINDAQSAALTFENDLKTLNLPISADDFPIFDILFLGLGPDGHTCSLFSGHFLLQEQSKWIAVIEDSPKPPPRRITITLPVINHAREVVFLATGASKANVIKGIIEDKDATFPPSHIDRAETKWLLDKSAASKLFH